MYDRAKNIEHDQDGGRNQEDIIAEIHDSPMFLTSDLPATKDPTTIINVLASNRDQALENLSSELQNQVLHDIASFSLTDLHGEPAEMVRECFQKRFESNPFIELIIEEMDPDIYFGEMKELVQTKCKDVPVPSRRELTENIQIIYSWFRELSSERFSYDIPGAKSERLTDEYYSESKDS